MSSRVTPYDTYKNKNKINLKVILTKIVNFYLYYLNFKRRADVLTCVSKDMVKQYQEIFAKQNMSVFTILSEMMMF